MVAGRTVAKKIVLLSDGTGNAASKVWRTNVWRVFELLDLSRRDQVARYDDGVGSSSFKPLALLGGVFGWGLKRNVLDLYKFLCRNYEPEAKIYGFGFSRGAFTIRVLVDFALDQGLIAYGDISEAELDRRAKAAYRAYRTGKFHSVLRFEQVFRAMRDAVVGLRERLVGGEPYDKANNITLSSIEFVGLWDTVAAYGTPVEEMTRGISQWLWPLELPNRILRPEVRRACQALAIDDDRTPFHPVLWTEEGEPAVRFSQNGTYQLTDERVSQVWFAGAHSNVGGGYPDDALAKIPLYWIMNEAKLRGLTFKTPPKADPNAFRTVRSAQDKDGRLYRARAGLGGYYQYGPRKLRDLCRMRVSSKKDDRVEITLPKIHESVFRRIRSDSTAYAPIGLPGRYAVVMEDGSVVRGRYNQWETPAQARAREKDQESVWNLVWLRRIVYFLTIIASMHIALFWLFHDISRSSDEFTSPLRPVSELVRLTEAFFPAFVQRWWGNVYAANQKWVLLGVLSIAVLVWLGSRLETQIADRMRMIWVSRKSRPASRSGRLNASIYWFRTRPLYLRTRWEMKRHVVPLMFAILVLYLGVAFASHLSFYVLDANGAFCTEGANTLLEPPQKVTFKAEAPCFATGVKIVEGGEYCISIKPKGKWKDGRFTTDLRGFSSSDDELNSIERVLMYAAVPLRRVMFRRWFRVIARVGSVGTDEYFLDPPRQGLMAGKLVLPLGGPRYPVRRDGELFLYVNEAVVGVPGLSDFFYRNNHGEAEVTIVKMPKDKPVRPVNYSSLQKQEAPPPPISLPPAPPC